jgi:uncharacterized protein
VEFEWDPTKAEANLRKHGVAFPKVIEVFQDPFRQDQPDTWNDYGEDRWITLDRVEHAVLHVVSTRRGENIRLISARKATRNEQRVYWDGYLPL